MALLSSDNFRAVDTAQPTRARKYVVGQRIFENGFLRYGSGDYVDEEEARRIEEVHGLKLIPDPEPTGPQMPSVTDNIATWQKYAKEQHNMSVQGKQKQQLIDEIYEKEGVKTSDKPKVEVTDVKKKADSKEDDK